MRLRRLEDRAAHVSRGILPAPGVFVFEVGGNARPVALCLVVHVRTAHVILTTRLLSLLLFSWIPLLPVRKVPNRMMLLLMNSSMQEPLVLLFFGVMVVVLMINGEVGGFVRAACRAASMTSSNEILLSREGVTQGDPLSMMLYSVATLPLVQALKGNGRWSQNWYADDFVCAGSLDDIRCWLDRLSELGPSYVYFPEPVKVVWWLPRLLLIWHLMLLLNWVYLLFVVTPFRGCDC